MTQQLIFSGVQPTGNLHLGNYLGAIKNWVSLQNQYKSIFCIVDLHAITVPQNPAELKNNIYELTAAYIACGIDPSKAIIFQQSDVKEHTELAWILGCNTPLGWLNRMTQFKEKSGKNKENAPLGLYGYPVLMAADILLYNTNLVPVGDDQKQHIELTRDIANSFNQKYQSEVFTIPEPMILPQGKRIMSLRDGTKKMSKSDESDYSRINLSDDAEAITQKFKKAQTDSINEIYYDLENRPAISNLLTIYASLAEITIEQAQQQFKTANFSAFKNALAEMAVEKLSPITTKFNEIKNDKTELQKILDIGAENARKIAVETINKVKEVVGF